MSHTKFIHFNIIRIKKRYTVAYYKRYNRLQYSLF